MSERGVFAVDRGIWDHPRFHEREGHGPRPYSKREAFLWLISEASFKSRRFLIGSAVVELQRGQLAHSLRYLARAWNWKEPRVRRFLSCLKTDAMIDAGTNAGQTVITICNYNKYQWPLTGSAGPTDGDRDAATTHQRRKTEECNTGRKKGAPSAPPAAASSAAKPKRSKSLAARVYAPGFEAFFSGYPKTTTTNPKAECFDVWERLTVDDQAAAMASLSGFAEHCLAQWQGYQPPGAAVYLRKRRFDDFAPAPVAPVDPEKRRKGWQTLARAHLRGDWHPNWGPRPGEPGCTIPADVIAEARQEAVRLQ